MNNPRQDTGTRSM